MWSQSKAELKVLTCPNTLRLTIQMDTMPNPDLSQLKDLREAGSSAALGWMRQLSLGKALLLIIP